MTISGFTFIRNGFKLQYPFLESIRSILPLCNEMIVVVGRSEDATREAIETLAPGKIKIIDTVWDEQLRAGGKILADQTNIALDAISGDWGLYLQGDEVIHENELDRLADAARKNLTNPEVDGLLFDWYHFFGNYDFIAAPNVRGIYPHEVRLIRNHRGIRSYRDAQGFRKFPNPHNGSSVTATHKLRVKHVMAHVYHYGKVRGPQAELERAKSFHKLWHQDDWVNEYARNHGTFDYSTTFPLVRFEGSHPAVMHERIRQNNWDFIPDPGATKIPLKYQVLNTVERLTGWRPFEFRNYVLV